MTLHFKRCSSEEDLAEASLFLLDRRRDLHPSFTTLDTVTLLYQYMTQGHLHGCVDPDGRFVGVFAYYIGAPEEAFADRTFAMIDIAVLDKAYRGTRIFLKGLAYMTDTIRNDHAEAREIRIAALAENRYLCKLYAKFVVPRYHREGRTGTEMVFSEQIDKLCTTLRKYKHV